MILWKIWFDLRVRFFFCLAFLILSVLLMILLFPFLGSFLPWVKSDVPPQEWARMKPYISSYRLFMEEKWFGEVQFIGGFAVILSLGGVMTERRPRSIYFTLSLPVLRRKWIFYHAGLALALVLSLCCVASIFILLGSRVFGETYPVMHAAQSTLFLGLLTFPWIGATFAMTSLTQDKAKTALLIFCLWFVTSLLQKLQGIRLWLPQHLVDYFNGAPFPWQSLLVILVVGIGGILFAIQRFEKQDY